MGPLSIADGGMLWSMAKQVLSGDCVSLLRSSPDVISPRVTLKKPARTQIHTRSSIPTTLSRRISIKESPFKIYNTLSDREILPELAGIDSKGFYYFTAESAEKTRMDVSIFDRRAYPPSPRPMIGTLTIEGLYQFNENGCGTFTEMEKYQDTKLKAYLTSNIELFRGWEKSKCFKKWFVRSKTKRMENLKDSVIRNSIMSDVDYVKLYMRIHSILDTETIPLLLPPSTEEFSSFEEFSSKANECLTEIGEVVARQRAEVISCLTQFETQIKGMAEILQYDYEVLKELNVLPGSIIALNAANDSQCTSSILAKERLRLLQDERNKANKKMRYFPTFLELVRVFYKTVRAETAEAILRSFCRRFTAENGAHLVGCSLLSNDEYQLQPSCDELTEWFGLMDKKVRLIFIDDKIEVNEHLDNQLPWIRFGELDHLRDAAVEFIAASYSTSTTAAQFSREVIQKCAKTVLDFGEIEDGMSKTEFLSKTAEIRKVEEALANVTCMFRAGCIRLDLVVSRKGVEDQVSGLLNDLKVIGLKMVTELFVQFTNEKAIYIGAGGELEPFHKMDSPQLEAARKLESTALSFIDIGESLINQWGPTLSTVSDQLDIVKSTLSRVQPKMHRSPRLRKTKKKALDRKP